ncbi:MAG: IMP dehydrogenase [Candidatus Magasanikbacteria bacterium CG10_big_fil_rev_8_21_14_0_10_47_10]|uniref:Inosine-5'-monophosphate dehydrogenase n=1 Tax=Candidatus Magasanikbacteria bacterium CG10_big_fil_rev_8_21_14_0_10_47_10 TaxID=1974652 RepID=A0A2H0TRL1_9BACT|nr:MAG: IMP dehydrogenase [Candidatus Magasanikbacteria bacterium CG10_big_fil_rev_8_21_14_0_10_47_10]
MFDPFEATLTFDDVLLIPQHSDVLPKDVTLHAQLTRSIQLNNPFLSAPMDTVTQAKMAISMALAGGLGVIHKNLSIEEQAYEVHKVKRFENGFIMRPATVGPNDTIQRVMDIREQQGFKKTPVVDENGILLGIISDVDYFIPDDAHLLVKDRMTPATELILAKDGITLDQANMMIREFKLRTLCIVDEKRRLVSMVTRHDIEKNHKYPDAAKDENKQLRVGAAVGVGQAGLARAEALLRERADVLVVDTAHGDSDGVISTVLEIKAAYPSAQVIAGNIATAEAAHALINAGADAVKVGIGPGSICTTRVVAGIGVPQLSAILEVAKGVHAAKKIVPLIADGGIKTSGDIVKALAAGASTVMMGNLFAGTDESPGRVEFIDGRMFKTYRGMGSLQAMEQGSKDRYGQADVTQKMKFVPEGVSGRVPYKGTVDRILYQLAGGLRSGMGYTGSRTIADLQRNAHFVKISGSSLKESHPHDLGRIEDAPNYRVGE